MRMSRTQIVNWLKGHGMVFAEFTVTYEGHYTPDDVDWNYKDMVHVNYVHAEQVTGICTPVEKDVYGSYLLYRTLGLTVPINTVAYQTSANSMTTMQTALCFAVVVEEIYEQLAPLRTRVHSIYSVGSPWLFQWCLPFIRRILIKNKHKLMDGDGAMRERRGDLRSRGYSFYKGAEIHRCSDTLDVSQTHVIPPKNMRFHSISWPLVKELPDDGERFIGQDDHLGLRIVRQGQILAAYPRLCMHEGASLDNQPCANGQIQCPWHGRVSPPLAKFDLNLDARQEISTQHHQFAFEKGVLQINSMEVAAHDPSLEPA